jgi:hypothetical protein
VSVPGQGEQQILFGDDNKEGKDKGNGGDRFCQLSLSVLDERCGFGGGVLGWIGAEQIGVAGKGFAGLAVDEEANLFDLWERGVKCADDRLNGEGFDQDAGGMRVGEGSMKIDDG